MSRRPFSWNSIPSFIQNIIFTTHCIYIAHKKMRCSASTRMVNSVNPPVPVERSSPTHPHRRPRNSIINEEQHQGRAQAEDLVQNFLLVWLDENLDQSEEDFRNSITQLQQ